MDICPSARRFIANQTNETRQKLLVDLQWLEDNPYVTPDEGRKRPILTPPAVCYVYEDGVHWIIYYSDGGVWKAANIGNKSEPLSLHRPS
jgi:hypothetical protein